MRVSAPSASQSGKWRPVRLVLISRDPSVYECRSAERAGAGFIKAARPCGTAVPCLLASQWRRKATPQSARSRSSAPPRRRDRMENLLMDLRERRGRRRSSEPGSAKVGSASSSAVRFQLAFAEARTRVGPLTASDPLTLPPPWLPLARFQSAVFACLAEQGRSGGTRHERRLWLPAWPLHPSN
jgi:hypothetical protein